jgi:hypothetical protein
MGYSELPVYRRIVRQPRGPDIQLQLKSRPSASGNAAKAQERRQLGRQPSGRFPSQDLPVGFQAGLMHLRRWNGDTWVDFRRTAFGNRMQLADVT